MQVGRGAELQAHEDVRGAVEVVVAERGPSLVELVQHAVPPKLIQMDKISKIGAMEYEQNLFMKLIIC